MHRISDRSKWIIAGAIYALSVGPTFISYKPYVFRQDDSDYLYRAIAASRAFWSGNARGLLGAMVGVHPPAMTLIGLPWGPLTSWDDACKCFLTLAATIALLAAFCLYLLLRIGVKPHLLALASVCVGASLGPLMPDAPAHVLATSFMSDNFLAWTALTMVLFIPFEARVHCPSIKGSVLQGILLGAIISLGTMTKMNFIYFILLVVPILFLMRLHYDGLRIAVASLIALACASAPCAIFFLRWGRVAFENTRAASFGPLASLYYTPLLQFIGTNVRESPGLVFSFALTSAGLIYLLIKKRTVLLRPDGLALIIMIGFTIIVLVSHARLIRYLFPPIVALPFLVGILMSGKGYSASPRSAAVVASCVFLALLAAGLPTLHRATREASLGRADAVLALAVKCNDKDVVLATDSPTLNEPLILLSKAVTKPAMSIETPSVVYNAMNDEAIEKDFQTIQGADIVVLQDDAAFGRSFITDQRVPEYRHYISGLPEYSPVRVWSDVTAFSKPCRLSR